MQSCGLLARAVQPPEIRVHNRRVALESWATLCDCFSQALRQLSRLTTGVCFIPLINDLARPFKCDGATWLHSNFGCQSSARVLLVVAAVIGLFALLVGALIGAHTPLAF